MTQTSDDLAFVGAMAAQIDRVIVRGHELAGAATDRSQALTEMKAFPQLLSTAAIVLLARPLLRAEFARIVPYTPPALVDGLIDNNASEGIVEEREDGAHLTDLGRGVAEDMVAIQEAVVAEAWASANAELDVLEPTFGRVVENALSIERPRTPANFDLFAGVCDRPTVAGRVLRTITAVRYWRADAHAAVIDDAGLRPAEAHALNRLWDADRAVDRVGQGFPDAGRKGVASLEDRGLADAGAITAAGRELREQIERDTDRRTAPVYDALDVSSRERLLGSLSALLD
jgi:hypothetical protein